MSDLKQNELSTARAEIEALRKDLEETRDELELTRYRETKLIADMSEIGARSHVLETQRNKHFADLEQEMQKCDGLSAEIEALRKQNELTHSAYVDENNRLMAEREALRKRVGELESLRPSVAELERDEAIARAEQAETQLAVARDGNRPLPYDRDYLGRLVREAWVRWAYTQPNPKSSWLVDYDELAEPDKEADRQIGECIARWTIIGDAARAALAQTSPAIAPVGREG